MWAYADPGRDFQLRRIATDPKSRLRCEVRMTLENPDLVAPFIPKDGYEHDDYNPGRTARLEHAMNPPHIRLYIKPGCPWCHQALDWLKRHHIKHETLDVIGTRRLWPKWSASPVSRWHP